MIALLASLVISQFGPEIFSEPIPQSQSVSLPLVDGPKGKVDLFIKFAQEDFLTQIDPKRKPIPAFQNIIDLMGSESYNERDRVTLLASVLPLEYSWSIFYYGLKSSDSEVKHRCEYILKTQHICGFCGGTGICGFCMGKGECNDCYRYREINKIAPLTPTLAKKRYRDSICGRCFGTGDFILSNSDFGD